MKRLLLFFALVLLAVGLVNAQTTTSRDADEKELSRLENVWNQAQLRGDANTLNQLWTDDVVVIVPGMRPFAKSDLNGVLQAREVKFDRYETSEIAIRIYDDAAVVTGRLKRTRTINGRAADDDWRFTKMYIRRSGKWQVVAYHSSPVAL